MSAVLRRTSHAVLFQRIKQYPIQFPPVEGGMTKRYPISSLLRQTVGSLLTIWNKNFIILRAIRLG
jgi:hypothetical protein